MKQTNNTPTNRLTTAARLALATGAIAVASLVWATAASASTAETTDPVASEARIQKACARVPVVSERVDDHIARLSGDAATQGSLLWLEGRIASASSDGQERKAMVLENRLTVRTARLELLLVRATALDELQAMCDEHVAS